MAGAYSLKWMGGAEALDYLSEIEPRMPKRLAILQAAVRKGTVRGRPRPIQRDMRWLLPAGFDCDADIPGNQLADQTWWARFIDSDPWSVDPEEFAAKSEFLREHVLALWSDAESHEKVTSAKDAAPPPSGGYANVTHAQLVAFLKVHFGAPGAATNRDDMKLAAEEYFRGLIQVKALAAARQAAGVKGRAGRPRKSGK